MRYAIIADIHANLVAFKAVLDHIERHGGVEEIWCLGDVVGYGPDPCQCIELLRQYNHVCVAGNHDWAAIGKAAISEFNPDAAVACRWTAQQLSPKDVEYIESLPEVIQKGDFTLVHGSPRSLSGSISYQSAVLRKILLTSSRSFAWWVILMCLWCLNMMKLTLARLANSCLMSGLRWARAD